MRFLLSVPVLFLLVLFALSNKQPVRMYLWPTDLTVDAPLSIAVLVAAGVFFLAGALLTWGGTLAARARARRAETEAAALRAQVRTLEARPVAPPRVAPNPMPAPAPAIAAPASASTVPALPRA